jgi:phosphatidylglycerophosphatase A
MGHANRHVLRYRTVAARAGDLGIVGNSVAVGGAGPRPFGFPTNASCNRDWLPIAIAMAVLVTLIGIPAATRVARGAGKKDPQFIVIDEVAGQLVALIAVPLAWKSFLAGFILFRAFDIVKPPPVRQLEAIPEGAGIILDDVAAGLYALLVVHLFLHFGLLR